MIYFTVNEIVRAMIYFFVFGIAYGVIYPSLSTIVRFVYYFLFSFFRAYKRYIKSENWSKKSKQNKKINTIRKQLLDFAFTVFAGIVYILMIYLLLDGVFRAFTAFFFVFGYLFSKKTIGNAMSKAISYSLGFILKVFDLFVYVISYPLFICTAFLWKIIKPKLAFLLKKYRASVLKHKIMRKSRAIDSILEII